MKLEQCTQEEIDKIIMSLNSNSSNGYDNISTKFMKKYREILANPITKYINSSFVTGVYPESLKIGCVVPIHKKGNSLECANYRPITKLSVIDKIFEEAILSRLRRHIENNDIIDRNQFGFTKNSNTTAACINCMETIYESIDKGKYVAMLSIDLAKAFDSAHTNTLISKLKEIKIKNKPLEILESFLRGRRQFVKINKTKSTNRCVKVGVPQGSKLAATLFIIYINGILKLQLKSKPQFYADDGIFIFTADNFEELIEHIRYDIQIIYDWFRDNQLQLNVSKTKIMIIDNHRNEDIKHWIGINFNGELIKKETSIKFLGLTIDDKITWNDHLNQLKNKLNAICFAVYKMRKIVPKHKLWLLYHAHFLSNIYYLNPIWNGCKEQTINEMQRLQNKSNKNHRK